MSKRSSESSNNNRHSHLLDITTRDGSHDDQPRPDPLEEFETEHIPDAPAEDQGHALADVDHMDSNAVDNHVHGGVTNVGSRTQDSGQPTTERNSALSLLFILLIVALIVIPIAVVIQSNKQAIKASALYRSFDRWF